MFVSIRDFGALGAKRRFKAFRWLVAVVVLLFHSAGLMAQRTVQGTVSDAATGEAIIGAAVRVKEHSSIGSVTDQKGHYLLQLPDSKACHIEVSFLGYHTKNQQIKSGSSVTLDVALDENVSLLETVVVTGTRTPKLLKDVPVITRVIDAKEILATDVGNVQDLLQAELPGIEPAGVAQHARLWRQFGAVSRGRRAPGGRNLGQCRLQPPRPQRRGSHRNRERRGFVALWLQCRGWRGQPHQPRGQRAVDTQRGQPLGQPQRLAQLRFVELQHRAFQQQHQFSAHLLRPHRIEKRRRLRHDLRQSHLQPQGENHGFADP